MHSDILFWRFISVLIHYLFIQITL